MPANSSNLPLVLTPLGAGDLIDRAVRFYRNNFWTFVIIAAPPIIVGTVISTIWTLLARALFDGGSPDAPENYIFSALFTGFGNFVIWMIEGVATLIVMGGASRNFVRHILFQEPITVRETYRNVRSRLGGLLAASSLIALVLSMVGGGIFYFGLTVLIITVALLVMALVSVPFAALIVSIFAGLAIVFGTIWVFFLVASRFAYVPQVMLVEGQGVFAAVGRSATLASGNVRRLVALFVFTLIATYSALSLLYLPLGWYAYLNGVEFFEFGGRQLPDWYVIANQVVSQASFILLTPIWMIGLCLLYVDERVRHEGYDIELLAARRLGEIPALPREFVNPLQPALETRRFLSTPGTPSKSGITTLGLNER